MGIVSQELEVLCRHQSLTFDQMQNLMRRLMQGGFTSAQIAAILIALKAKGESVYELAAAASVMRELMVAVPLELPNLVDSCGTGGDGADIFNVSTAAAFVAAAAGANVAKHGNRSVSSRSGSADVLQKLGLELSLSAETVARCIESVGIGFMFAPNHHTAMKHAIEPRRELGVRTLFNLLGPMTNPANVPNQVVGVFDKKWLYPLAEAFLRLGSQHVLVVHSEDGLDEFSINARTHVCELRQGEILSYIVDPESFGVKRQSLRPCTVTDPEQSAQLIKGVFDGAAESAPNDMVALNAGAVIYAANLVSSLAMGVEMAQDIISAGLAKEKLNQFVQFASLSQNP